MRYMADELKIDKFEPFIPTANQTQYLNPVQHVGQKKTPEELSGALAVSVQVDDSANIFCVQNVTSKRGLIYRFLGFCQPVELG